MPNGGLKKIDDLIRSIYLVNDPYITKVIMASLVTHKIKGDPVWIVIVAPSGGAKSEFINITSQCDKVIQISTLSTHTFASGMRNVGKEASLLTKIGSGVITFKDLTSLLSENKEDRGVIMGQLREIYDGKYNKKFGNGLEVDWKGKITVLAGATYSIHTLKQAYTAMGERFLFYNMVQPERIDAARRTTENQEAGYMAERRLESAAAVKVYIDSLDIPVEIPKLDDDLIDDLLDLAELATRARSETERDWRSPGKEITEVHPPEMPTRFAGQLVNFARGLMVVNYNETGKFDILPEDKKILYKLALDSVTKSKRTAMQELARYDSIHTSGLATKLGLPTATVRRWLEDLTALGVAQREKGTGAKGDHWKVLPKYRSIMEKFEGIQREHMELTEKTAEGGQEGMKFNEELSAEESAVELKKMGF